MFCTNCGRKLPDGSVFCPGCGTKVEERQPAPAPAAAQVREPSQAWQAEPVREPAPVYTAPEVPAHEKELASKRAGIWPAVCGVMGVLALAFHLSAYAFMAIFGYMRFAFPTVAVISFILMAVAFFVHTRKIPWVTIFPFLIYLIFMLYQSRYFLTDLTQYYRGMGATYIVQALTTLLPVIIFIFYMLIVLIRPRGAALRVFLMIFTLIEIFLLIVSPFITLSVALAQDLYYIGYIILIRLALIFFYIGYLVAGMNVRKA